ncbi:MAG: hypothetical protein R3F23_01695 [Verrucomicrobiia bacterium]
MSNPFDFEKDHFAFANETVWNYESGKPSLRKKNEKHYTRRCFVVARAALQFWKFAKFTPQKPKLTQDKLVERIRQITRTPVWKSAFPISEKIEIPGYANLNEASQKEPVIFQQNIGLGWPTYFRPGNFPIVLPPSHFQQAKLHNFLQTSLQKNQPVIVWLINFPSLSINHAVVVFHVTTQQTQYDYLVYDPNTPQRPLTLSYHPDVHQFNFEKTFYFRGGKVQARPVYLSPFQ